MGENIVTSLVNHQRQLDEAKHWRNSKRRNMEDAAIEFSGAVTEVVAWENKTRKLKNSIKTIWGEEALEIAMKAVKEDQEKAEK